MKIPARRLRIQEGCIRIDASHGEGGGQIVRTACALSALTGVACELFQIRGSRTKPGLMPQHCAAVRGLARLCDADITALKPGVTDLTFVPGRLQGRELSLDTGTAGSIGLVLQGLLLAGLGLEGPTRFTIRGGTDVPLAPPCDYLQSVKRSFLLRMGYRIELSILRRGYYPKGGGVVDVRVYPPEAPLLQPLWLPNATEAVCSRGISFASSVLSEENVVQKQRRRAIRHLTEYLHVPAKISEDYGASNCPGSGLVVWAETRESILGASALGNPGKSADEVAEQATEQLLRIYNSRASVDPWLGDQILPYLALSSGPSMISVPHVTRHMQTNMWLVERFLNVRFNCEVQGSFVTVTCDPEDVKRA
jgi:RNA 3'-phosphate cyclase